MNIESWKEEMLWAFSRPDIISHDGGFKSVCFKKNNKFYNIEFPNRIIYYEKSYYISYCNDNSELHREDGPANIHYYKNGKVFIESYYIKGKRHRENGPADIWYYENGNIKTEMYFINDLVHRNDGPSIIHYYKNGSIHIEEYYIQNNKHRENGPAHVEYYENGNIKYEEYYKQDILLYIISKIQK
jgi:uncharacterized protein